MKSITRLKEIERELKDIKKIPICREWLDTDDLQKEKQGILLVFEDLKEIDNYTSFLRPFHDHIMDLLNQAEEYKED